MFIVIGPLAGMPSFGQDLQSGMAPTLPSASAAAYYYIAKPGELTMQVNVWGFVGKPGRYEIPTSTDLIQLISFAGGPLQHADMDEVRITRIARNGGTESHQQFVIDLEDASSYNQSELVLYPGDTVFIDHTSWLTFRDLFSVVTTVAIITSAIAQILWASR